MKPVNKNIADGYHRDSSSGVDAVFKRMLAVVGDCGEGYAAAFDVSDNTIKTWRRRGGVALKYLEGFAREHNVSLDHLLYGEKKEVALDEIQLSPEERLLVDRYRSSPQPLKDAALRVLLGGDPAAGDRVQKVKTNNGQMTQGGKIINKGGGKKT